MALTLTQSADLSQNKLVKGIAEELVKESPLMGKYPWVNLTGNALALNREDTTDMGSVAFYNVGATWNESSASFNQYTFSLYTLGADCDVPTLIQKSRSNINDQMAAQIKVKSKLMAHEFENQAIYGTTGTGAGFAGLHYLIASGQQVHMVSSGTTGTALTTAKLDQLVDTVMGGKPDLLLMNKQVRRRLSKYLRGVGSYMTERDDYGNYFVMWNEIPIVVTDWLTQTEALSSGAWNAKTGASYSSIFAIRFGEGDGLIGLQNGDIQTEYWEKLENKDAQRVRIKWYVGQALYSTLALARLDGISDAAVSA